MFNSLKNIKKIHWEFISNPYIVFFIVLQSSKSYYLQNVKDFHILFDYLEDNFIARFQNDRKW